jgi:probable HAF family extracellular repeat protein
MKKFKMVQVGVVVALVVTMTLGYVGWAGASNFFTGLGDLSGGVFESSAWGVSGDGLTVVGYSVSSNGKEAFRWTKTGGMVGMGDALSGPPYWNVAGGASYDGSVIAGSSWYARRAWRWTQATGMQSIGQLGGGFSDGGAISQNGSVLAGSSDYVSSKTHAFRWTAATGMVSLGDLMGGSARSSANGISGDGSIVVGFSESASGWQAFRWTQATSMVGLGDLEGGSFASRACGISNNGAVIVGYGNSASGQEAFRYTAGSGMVGLGDLGGGSFSSYAKDASADGAIIVGSGNTDIGQEAFIWDAVHGMRNLEWVLTNEYGLDLTGWTLKEAVISDDGLTFAGWGTNPSGQTEAWSAHVVPLPPAAFLFGSGMVALAFLKRRCRRS